MKTLGTPYNARIAAEKSIRFGGGIRAVRRSFSRTATRRKPGLLRTEFFVVERRRRE